MKNDMGKTNLRDSKIKLLLEHYLQSRLSSTNSEAAEHLDEDTFAAFVEGNLTEATAQPIVNHLVNCGFCLRVSAELVKLNDALADDANLESAASNPPSKVSEVLNNLLSRIFGDGNENVVFAHQESEREISDSEDKEKLSEDKN